MILTTKTSIDDQARARVFSSFSPLLPWRLRRPSRRDPSWRWKPDGTWRTTCRKTPATHVIIKTNHIKTRESTSAQKTRLCFFPALDRESPPPPRATDLLRYPCLHNLASLRTAAFLTLDMLRLPSSSVRRPSLENTPKWEVTVALSDLT